MFAMRELTQEQAARWRRLDPEAETGKLQVPRKLPDSNPQRYSKNIYVFHSSIGNMDSIANRE